MPTTRRSNYLRQQQGKRVRACHDASAERRCQALRGAAGAVPEVPATATVSTPLMLAAQGYQESQLNQNAKSHVGAIGGCR